LNFTLPKTYPITDNRLSGICHAGQVEKLIAGGAKIIQLREKRDSPRGFYEDAAKAIAVARGNGVRIIINDRVDIALALNADGAHLGQDDLPPVHARKILGPDAIIGFSTHSLEQARSALSLPIDYIAIGPIFATATKENPEAAIGIEGLATVRNAIGDFPLVAIGGIRFTNLEEIFAAGADSAAMIQDLVSDAAQITYRMREHSKFHS